MFRKLFDSFKRTKTWKWARALAERIILPGFEGIPLYDVSRFFFTGIHKGGIITRASSLAFFFFLAIFPLVIFFFTLIPYVPIRHFQDYLMEILAQIMPENAFKATENTLKDIITHQRGGLLSFGFFAALYFSSNGFNRMISAFHKTYHDIETRKPLTQWFVSLQLVLITTLLLLAAIALIIYSEVLLNKIFGAGHGKLLIYLVSGGRWLIIFALFFCAISFTYYLGPSKKSGWKFVSAGSTFATLLSIATSIAFAYYVNHFGRYNKLYGSIGTLIVIMLWLYFNCIVLLLGFELNASIHHAKKKGKELNVQSED